jgi:uncharacterized Zn finger protein
MEIQLCPKCLSNKLIVLKTTLDKTTYECSCGNIWEEDVTPEERQAWR